MTLATLSYLTAALAFLILAALAVIRWRDRPGILWVLGASLLSLGWALYLALLSWEFVQSTAIYAGILEVGRNTGWFAVLLSVLAMGNPGAGGYTRSLRLWIALTAVFVALLLVPFLVPGLPGAEHVHGLSLLAMTLLRSERA